MTVQTRKKSILYILLVLIIIFILAILVSNLRRIEVSSYDDNTEDSTEYMFFSDADARDNPVDIDIMERRNKYANMMAKVSQVGLLPEEDMNSANCKEYFLSNDGDSSVFYSVEDIDLDGEEELLLLLDEYDAPSVADTFFAIYGYDLEKNETVLEYFGEQSSDVYSSQVILEKHSLGEGSPEVRPTSFYRFDPIEGKYNHVATISGIDKEYIETGFPAYKDLDGDGRVYAVEGISARTLYMDNAEYEMWCSEFVGKGTVIDSSLMKINYDEIESNSSAYKDYLINNIQKASDGETLDLMLCDSPKNDVYSIDTVLSVAYNATKSKVDGQLDIVYTIDGVDAILVENEGVGRISYNKRVDGIEMCGLYPGMDIDEATEKLLAFGFEQSKNNNSRSSSFKAGCGGDFYEITLVHDGNILTSISYYCGSDYLVNEI